MAAEIFAHAVDLGLGIAADDGQSGASATSRNRFF